MYFLNGDPIDLEDFFRDNEDGLDATEVAAIRSLLPGGLYRGGGGAWAEWEIERSNDTSGVWAVLEDDHGITVVWAGTTGVRAGTIATAETEAVAISYAEEAHEGRAAGARWDALSTEADRLGISQTGEL